MRLIVRKANQALESDIGVPILEADYSNQNSLVQLFEGRRIDTVMSCISNYDASQNIELDIIAAADQASHTRRYIPSVWSGFDYTDESVLDIIFIHSLFNMYHRHGKDSSFAASRLVLLEALSKTKLEWTAIFPGIFLDFYTLSIDSNVKRTALAIDMDGNAAAIPGDGNYPMYFTHTTDIAKYTNALLGLDNWEKKYYLVGNEMTWNEVVAIAEEAKGVKFNVAYDSVEKLKTGVMTELPGHKATYEHIFANHNEDVKAMFQKVISVVAVFMAEGNMVYKGLFSMRSSPPSHR